MSIPSTSIDVPARVRMLAGSARLTPVWLNGIGGLTFRTDDGRFIKWGPHDPEANMRDEAERMRWARRWITVPEVIDHGREWLVTAALPGRSAVDPRWHGDPRTAVRAVGAALRTMHDSLPVDECPWTWDPASRPIESGSPTTDGCGTRPDAQSRASGPSISPERHPDRHPPRPRAA